MLPVLCQPASKNTITDSRKALRLMPMLKTPILLRRLRCKQDQQRLRSEPHRNRTDHIGNTPPTLS
jgi:hypothetical protein